jgi:hypothetical protein
VTVYTVQSTYGVVLGTFQTNPPKVANIPQGRTTCGVNLSPRNGLYPALILVPHSVAHLVSAHPSASGYSDKSAEVHVLTGASTASTQSVAAGATTPNPIHVIGSATPYSETGSFLEPGGILTRVLTRIGFSYRPPVAIPQPPEPASQTDPSQATGMIVRPLYGTLIDPNHDPIISGGKPT